MSETLSANDLRRVGIVEIGSRAVRLLVADVSSDGLEVVASGYEQSHLAKAMREGKRATDASLELIRGAVERFVAECHALSSTRTGIFGTEAVRGLQLSGKLASLEHALGLQVVVLDQESEARCSMLAAVRGLPDMALRSRRIAVIDQGAGSMEVAIGVPASSGVTVQSAKSYELGTEALATLFKTSKGNVAEVRSQIDNLLGDDKVFVGEKSAAVLALGSAATKAAWLKVREDPYEKYAPYRVHGQPLTLQFFDAFTKAAAANPAKAKRLIDPRNPESGEYELVIGGLLGLSCVLRKLRQTELIVSGWSTRYGIAFLVGNAPSWTSGLQV